jgi:hypothetical protein
MFFICIIISKFFTENLKELSRLADYFRFGLPILLVILINIILQKYPNNPVIYVFSFLLLSYKLYILLNMFPEVLFPYKSVFE